VSPTSPAGADVPIFGCWSADPAAGGPAAGGLDGPDHGSAITSAFVHTPGRPLVLSVTSAPVAARLAEHLAATGRSLPGVNGPADAATSFAARWCQLARWREETGGTGPAEAAEAAEIVSRVHRRMRLFRLAELTPPGPGSFPPPGRARTATRADRTILAEWSEAFAREVNDIVGPGGSGSQIEDRLAHGGFLLWEAGGRPVSLAGVTRAVAGVVRVGPVYTPPEQRGAGYGGAVTAAISRAALAAGAAEVVLFTDLANPTSNALYQRIGYRPLSDRLVLSFSPA
jgi:RimJ/RimL family protein N-acetyltransferase